MGTCPHLRPPDLPSGQVGVGLAAWATVMGFTDDQAVSLKCPARTLEPTSRQLP